MTVDVGSIVKTVITDAPYAIAAASAAAAVLPPGKPGSKWAAVRAAIDWLAINIGNAKNAKPQDQ